MNSDTAIIRSLMQTERELAAEYCRTYTELADTSSGETIRSILDEHLRIIQTLAELSSKMK